MNNDSKIHIKAIAQLVCIWILLIIIWLLHNMLK